MLGMNSGKNLDQCALAAAVLARQAVNFTREDGEVDVGQGANPAETLADAVHFDERRFAFRCTFRGLTLRARSMRVCFLQIHLSMCAAKIGAAPVAGQAPLPKKLYAVKLAYENIMLSEQTLC